MKCGILLCTIFLLVPQALPDTILVPADYPTIQEAIDAAQSGDSVLVSAGTYQENIDFLGKSIVLQSVDGFESTVIDGGRAGSVVSIENVEEEGAIVDGFTICNGLAQKGGGIFCHYASPTIRNNKVVDNATSFLGNGLFAWYSSPLIENNLFTGNTATVASVTIQCDYSTATVKGNQIIDNSGAGVRGTESTLIVENNTILRNQGLGVGCNYGPAVTITGNTISENQAGGIYVSLTPATISNNLVDKNYEYWQGGGIICSEVSGLLVNNIITENSSDFWGGGGIYLTRSDLTITGNTISSNFTDGMHGGGGILCHSDHGSSIIYNRIEGNYALEQGGGICSQWSSTTIEDNEITNNEVYVAGFGAGIYCKESNQTVARNRIHGNIGHGLFCTLNSSLKVNGNSITNNTISGFHAGAGISCDRSFIEITNNIVSGNSTGYFGGGIACGFDSTSIISNNTVFGNSTGAEGGGIYFNGESTHTITNTICWNNTASVGPEIYVDGTGFYATLTISYSSVEGGLDAVHVQPGNTLNWGEGMIDADPVFVHSAAGDLHLRHDSPCRNTGDNASALDLTDFEGDPRIAWGETVDMGADEFHTHLYCMGDATPGGAVEAKIVGIPGTWPVGLFFGSSLLEEPFQHQWGEFWLVEPWFVVPLIPIATNGILVVPATIPGDFIAPVDLPMQALVGMSGDSLTNAFVLEIR